MQCEFAACTKIILFSTNCTEISPENVNYIAQPSFVLKATTEYRLDQLGLFPNK